MRTSACGFLWPCLFFCLNAAASDAGLSIKELDALVTSSYPYVATYNATNKLAIAQGGWNTCLANAEIEDEAARSLPPNTEFLYTSCLIDLREDAVVLNVPSVDVDYASMTVTAYDHYVKVALSTTRGDFREPKTILLYSQRTQRYDGQQVDGIDQTLQTSGDFVSVIFRFLGRSDPTFVMEQAIQIQPTPLLAFREDRWWPRATVDYPSIGATDEDIFASNLLEVMQFILNHTTIDPDDAVDQRVLAAYSSIGIKPGQHYNPVSEGFISDCQARTAVQRLREHWLSSLNDPVIAAQMRPRLFQEKGIADQDAAVAGAIIGPIGLPEQEVLAAQLSAKR